jgi:hypothetical protein
MKRSGGNVVLDTNVLARRSLIPNVELNRIAFRFSG